MPYAAATDMISRFGENELIRLSTPDGQALVGVNLDVVNARLADASAVIDTYLRKRYLVPLTAPIPAEINRACCMIARYDLNFGGDREPSEQVRLGYKSTIEWLESIRDGKTVLDGAIASGDESYAQFADRGFVTFQDDGDPTGANSGVLGGWTP